MVKYLVRYDAGRLLIEYEGASTSPTWIGDGLPLTDDKENIVRVVREWLGLPETQEAGQK